MQDRVHGSGAHFVAMTAEFFDHVETKDVVLTGMVKDVEPNEPGIKIFVLHVIGFRRRKLIISPDKVTASMPKTPLRAGRGRPARIRGSALLSLLALRAGV